MTYWNPRQETIEKYLAVCKAAAEDDEVFKTFKRNPDYTTILEHTSRELGEQYFKLIQEKNGYLLGYDIQNDKFGSPNVYDFSHGLGLDYSPTTLQYIAVVSNLIDSSFGDYIGENGDCDLDIIEIGGGYGGQCNVTKQILNQIPINYFIVDLPEVNALQEKYLKKCGREVFFLHTSENYPKEKEYDLVISNYALSEIKEPLQEQYIRDICLNSKHGYITCNAPLNSVHLLKEKFPTYKESPDIEGERKENFIITW